MDTPKLRLVSAAVVLAVALVLSFVTSTWVASRAYLGRGEQLSRGSRSLEVAGSARRRITSDLALWTLRVAGEGRTLEEAYAKLASSETRVQAFLVQQGLKPEPGPIHTTTHFKRDEKGNALREAATYELSRAYSVKSPEVARVGRAGGEVTQLLKDGAHVESLPPQFLFTGLQELKVEMLAAATRNARERAEAIARESGCRLGAVKDVRAGILQITPPHSTEVSSSGMNDTSSIEKDITSVVHLSLLIEAGEGKP